MTNTEQAKVERVAIIAHAKSDIRYVDGLECHLDEGGTTSPRNLRDLIAMVRWNAQIAIAAMEKTNDTA